ncbi:RIP metalloprotease RseP [Methylotuvimicrobium buryatense]|uniref:Zinc metalloprotease n=1 Tax=Methylotuvimicrobium buryatense TaxID=95641 RepID=A0A4P9UKL2_METBY|nr:RIP metalloprotease RseP [Methylotuvimicrobium buryatense]QCW81779.1 RIP metalloprotease RseP [Methylotuvimicrobium buryatense]
MSTLFYFIVAIGILVSFHEFGHFWVARKTGVKVLKFSVGFGKVIWSYQKSPASTEYAISAIPLGGYVKMVDEREGKVADEDLPFAFNRQPLWARSAIVAAGPLFNLMLAVLFFWIVLFIGETGLRPIIGHVEPDTLAAEAGLLEGEEIVAVNQKNTATWAEVIESIFSAAMTGRESVDVTVKNIDEQQHSRLINLPEELRREPDKLYDKLGLKPWMPQLRPVVGRVLEAMPAADAGLQPGDLIVAANGEAINTWMQWVEYVQDRPGTAIALTIERQGVQLSLEITPQKVVENDITVGKIGAAVEIPEDLMASLQVRNDLPLWPALTGAVSRTIFFSTATLKMMGQMILGNASVKNLSGPISIAQFAGLSAERGFVEFLSFLAKVSISLGVLNLLPIPVLDGGHLLFFAIEAIKGSPVSEKFQVALQQVGILLLLSLMVLALFLDLERLFQ